MYIENGKGSVWIGLVRTYKRCAGMQDSASPITGGVKVREWASDSQSLWLGHKRATAMEVSDGDL